MEKALRILIILSLIGAIALVAAIFVFWLPSLQAYVVTLEGGLPILSELVYPFSAVIALLCLGALGVALAFPSAMKKDQIFSCPTASEELLIPGVGTVASGCSGAGVGGACLTIVIV